MLLEFPDDKKTLRKILPQNLWEREGEDSLTGYFLREMRNRISSAADETQRATLERAVRYGLTALENGEDTP